jgi:hypothetical protein
VKARCVRLAAFMVDVTAVTLWKELLAGDWIVIDRYDASARRTLVLRKATNREKPSRAFTALERRVVTMATRAWSLKMMGGELGLGTSRVAEILSSVRAKLGAPTHADFLRMVGTSGLPAGAQGRSRDYGPAEQTQVQL